MNSCKERKAKNIELPGFPGGASGKEPTHQCRRHQETWGQALESGRSGGGHGNPFQYSFLENFMNRGTWQATVHGVTKNWTQLKTLSVYTHTWPLTANVCQPFLWMPGKCHRMLPPQNQGPLTDLASVLRPGQQDSIQIGLVD